MRKRFWLPWLLASAVGFGVGAGLGRTLAKGLVGTVGRDAQGGSIFAPGGSLLACAVAVSLGALMQWFVIRRRVHLAGLWALPTAVLFASYVVPTGDMPALAGGAAFGIVIGAIVGVPLAWVLRRSSSNARVDV